MVTLAFRPAEPADVPVLIELYDRHYRGGYSACFDRYGRATPQDFWWVQSEKSVTLIEVNRAPAGFLITGRSGKRVLAEEVILDRPSGRSDLEALLRQLHDHLTRRFQSDRQDCLTMRGDESNAVVLALARRFGFVFSNALVVATGGTSTAAPPEGYGIRRARPDEARHISRLYEETLDAPARPTNLEALWKGGDARVFIAERERYAVDLRAGWAEARAEIAGDIRSECARRVPGDTHRDLRVSTTWRDLRWKLCLLPLWIVAYRYGGKPYHLVVNGVTGKVDGEAPLSWSKILGFVLLLLVLAGSIAGVVHHNNNCSGVLTEYPVSVPLRGRQTFTVGPVLNGVWVGALPFLAEPREFALSQLLDVPQNRALLAGAWWFYGLFLLLALFNTVLGEELLFRGLLLPRMHGAFGNGDWLANGVLFGCYHLHQPWGIPGGVVVGALLFALPTKLFRSSWMSIAIHSGQSVFFAVVLFLLVLGAT